MIVESLTRAQRKGTFPARVEYFTDPSRDDSRSLRPEVTIVKMEIVSLGIPSRDVTQIEEGNSELLEYLRKLFPYPDH